MTSGSSCSDSLRFMRDWGNRQPELSAGPDNAIGAVALSSGPSGLIFGPADNSDFHARPGTEQPKQHLRNPLIHNKLQKFHKKSLFRAASRWTSLETRIFDCFFRQYSDI